MIRRKKKKEEIKEPEKSAVDQLLENRKKEKKEKSFKKSKPLLFGLSMVLCVVLVGGFYFLSSESRVKNIGISGNHYLTKEYIKGLTSVNLDSIFVLTFSSKVEKDIEKSDMIENAKVIKKSNGSIEIEVTEKQPVAYRYDEEPQLILSDGSLIPLKSEYLSVIAYIPYVDGFMEDEDTLMFAKAFKDVDKSMIENMAEIKQYSTNYDNAILQIFMRDGNYFFSSFFSLSVINSYNSIVSQLDNNGVCIFADDGLEVAYTSTCPWDVVPEEKEYWVDENGAFILNKYGDKIVKHYYTDEFGNFVLDEEGNKIPIPWDDPDKPLEEENPEETEEGAEGTDGAEATAEPENTAETE